MVSNASSNGLLDGIKNVTVSAYDYSKEIGSSIADKITPDSLKNIGQKSVSVLSTVGGLAYEGAQKAINKVKGGKYSEYTYVDDYTSNNTSEKLYRNDPKGGNYSGGNGFYQPPEVGAYPTYQRNTASNSYSNFSSDKLNVPNRNSSFFLTK